MIDVAAYIGPYPFRHLPHPDPDVLVRVLAREGLSGAWVGYLPSPWQRDPAPGNAALFAALAPYPTLSPTPAIRPDWPNWERALRDTVEKGAPAVRAYPMHWGMGPDDPAMRALALACGEIGIPLVLTTRFEDLRQRSPLDVAGDLSAAHVRALARAGASVRLIVTGAGRNLLEETHWGLTSREQERVHWDFAWIWGPPEDHLAHLLRTIGASRFVYGTHWPLRLTQNPRANLDLLPPDLRAELITVLRLRLPPSSNQIPPR
jgi:predicted TIM-barrel fold metal-dependent hydrolase